MLRTKIFCIVALWVFSSVCMGDFIGEGNIKGPAGRQSKLVVSEQFSDADYTLNPTWDVNMGAWDVNDGKLVAIGVGDNRIEINWDDPAGFDADTGGMTVVFSFKLLTPVHDVCDPNLNIEFGLKDTDWAGWQPEEGYYSELASTGLIYYYGPALPEWPGGPWSGFNDFLYDEAQGTMVAGIPTGEWFEPETALLHDQWQELTMVFDTRDGCKLYQNDKLVADWENGNRLRKVNQLWLSMNGNTDFRIDDVFVEVRTYVYASLFLGDFFNDFSGFTPWTFGGDYWENYLHVGWLELTNLWDITGPPSSAPVANTVNGWGELDLTQFAGFDSSAPMEIRFNTTERERIFHEAAGQAVPRGDDSTLALQFGIGNATQSLTETGVCASDYYGSTSGYHNTDKFGVTSPGTAGYSLRMAGDYAYIYDQYLTLNFDQDAKTPGMRIYYEEKDMYDLEWSQYAFLAWAGQDDPSVYEPRQMAFLESDGVLTAPTYFHIEDVGANEGWWHLFRFTLSDNTPNILDRFADGDYTNNQSWTVDSGSFAVSNETLEVNEPNSAIHLDFGGTYGVVNYSSVEVEFTLRQDDVASSNDLFIFGLYDTESGQGYTQTAALSETYYSDGNDSGFHGYQDGNMIPASALKNYVWGLDTEKAPGEHKGFPNLASESLSSTYNNDEIINIRFEAFGPTQGIVIRKNKRLVAHWPNFLDLKKVDRLTLQKGPDSTVTWMIDDVKIYAEVAGAPTYCGATGTQYLAGDISGPTSGVSDCYIDYYDVDYLATSWADAFDFTDFAKVAMQWLQCTDPANSYCDQFWP